MNAVLVFPLWKCRTKRTTQEVMFCWMRACFVDLWCWWPAAADDGGESVSAGDYEVFRLWLRANRIKFGEKMFFSSGSSDLWWPFEQTSLRNAHFSALRYELCVVLRWTFYFTICILLTSGHRDALAFAGYLFCASNDRHVCTEG